MLRLRFSAAVLLAGLLLGTPVTASPRFPIGEYVRITKSPSFPQGGRETGNLRILEASQHRVHFELEVTMNPQYSDDGALTHNGVIDSGEMLFKGKSAAYRSANPDDDTLGTCILNFRQSGHVIVVAQAGKCWWFGVGVNASGRYRPAKKGDVHVVHDRAF
jgi:hypothetical protein